MENVHHHDFATQDKQKEKRHISTKKLLHFQEASYRAQGQLGISGCRILEMSDRRNELEVEI